MREIICARSLEESRRKSARSRMVSHVAHPARRAQINKLLWRIWGRIESQFREPGDAYEGQLYIEKNAIWGCAGVVGRCPVVSAPPL